MVPSQGSKGDVLSPWRMSSLSERSHQRESQNSAVSLIHTHPNWKQNSKEPARRCCSRETPSAEISPGGGEVALTGCLEKPM